MKTIDDLNHAIETAKQKIALLETEKQKLLNDEIENWIKANVLFDWVNKIHLGDALALMQRIPQNSVDCIITSPPYNISHKLMKNGSWKSCKLTGDNEGYSDSMSEEEFIKWQTACLREMYRILAPGGAIFYNCKQVIREGQLKRTFSEIMRNLPVRQVITWQRPSGLNHNRAFFVPLSEQIYFIPKGDVRLSSEGAKMGDVWSFPFETNNKNNNPHPAPFPVELPRRCLKALTPKIVLDPFMGSGTTAIAAIEQKIAYIGIEHKSCYVEMAKERIKNFTLQTSQ